MRILGTIVLTHPVLMVRRQSDLGFRRAAGAKLVGHKHSGREGLFLQQLAHQFRVRNFVAPSLHEQVENLAIVVTARPTQNCRPAIITAVSSRCHCDFGRGRRRRSSECKARVELNGVPDDSGWKLVAAKRDRHPPSYPANRDAVLLP
jgi:hypothetical protein